MVRALLLILDGFGVAPREASNPRSRAKTPTLDRIEKEVFGVTLQASGISVGLPWGEPGNSEVGHLTLGAGRVMYHHLPRIIMAMRDGSFYTNEALKGAFDHAKRTGGRVHIMGLVSSGSVHAYVDHLYALFEMAQREGTMLLLHVFTDGRDAGPREAERFFPQIEQRMSSLAVGRIATICGRHYAMDRSGSWALTEQAYALLTQGRGLRAPTFHEALRSAYLKGLTDEGVSPTLIVPEGFDPADSLVRSGDALVYFNFREDSARQLAQAFGVEGFSRFPTVPLQDFYFVTMTQYERGLTKNVAFPVVPTKDTLGEVLSREGLTQLRVAETEKYAHVTYFFNGGVEAPFPGEERVLIPSHSDVAHDTIPEMRTMEIVEAIISAFEAGSHDVVIANLASGDMVGHTGNFAACAKAFEVLDVAVERLIKASAQNNITLFITADHGNVEMKIDLTTGRPLTEHSPNPVPFFIIDPDVRPSMRLDMFDSHREPFGLLADVAPTILARLGLTQPKLMTGYDVLKRG